MAGRNERRDVGPGAEAPVDFIVNGKVLESRGEGMISGHNSDWNLDIVLIAGKGAEQGQEFADRTEPFDDRESAREALRTLGART